jgi:hypothetical protein
MLQFMMVSSLCCLFGSRLARFHAATSEETAGAGRPFNGFDWRPYISVPAVAHIDQKENLRCPSFGFSERSTIGLFQN